jgi:L-threonylcarbamoyladenylate synthase
LLAETACSALSDTLPMNAASVRRASDVVLTGGVIGYPTDTVYGLGCDPKNAAAVDRLFVVKGREKKKPVPVLCSSLSRASELVQLDGLAKALARSYWPGPLTMVLPLRTRLPEQLHQGTGWVGVRVPAHRGCLSLIRGVGGWITGTSANLSGRPSCRSAEEVRRQLGDRIGLILDGGRLDGAESTVIRVEKGDVEVLRRGAISLDSGARTVG